MRALFRSCILLALCDVVRTIKLCHTMYLNADNSLEAAIIANLNKLVSNREFVGRAGYELHVLLDRRSAGAAAQGSGLQVDSPGAVQYRYHDGNLRIEGTTFNGAEVDMDSPSTLLAFLTDAWRQCKSAGADTFFLQGNSYGLSWEGFGGDENGARGLSNGMSLEQLQIVISQALSKNGIFKLDLLGFDASLMSSVAVARAFGHFSRYLLASESTVPGHGWAYDLLTTKYDNITWTKDMALTALGTNIIDTFADSDHGNPLGHQAPKTLAFLDLNEYVTLERRMDTFFGLLTSALTAKDGSLVRAIGRATNNVVRFVGLGDVRDARGYPSRSAVDLGDFFNQLSSTCLGSSVLQAKLIEVRLAYEEMIVHFRAGPGTAQSSTGVHMWLPTKQAAHDVVANSWKSYMCYADTTRLLPDGNVTNCVGNYFEAVPTQIATFMDQWYKKNIISVPQADPVCAEPLIESLSLRGTPFRNAQTIVSTTTTNTTTRTTTNATSTTTATATTINTTTTTTTNTTVTTTSKTVTITNTTRSTTTAPTTSTTNTTTTTSTTTTTNTTTTITTITTATSTNTSTTSTTTWTSTTKTTTTNSTTSTSTEKHRNGTTQSTTTSNTTTISSTTSTNASTYTTTNSTTTTTSTVTNTTTSSTTSSTTTLSVTNTSFQTTTQTASMMTGHNGCYAYDARRVLDGVLEVCDDRSRLTFQVLATKDVLFAEGSVNVNLRGVGLVTTHILTAQFNSNLVQSRFDGYFYMIGTTPVTIMQDSEESSWMALVDYFAPAISPQITNGVLVNDAKSKQGYLTFTAMQGRVVSALSLMVDFSVGGKGRYSAVLPSEGGTIVPRLYSASQRPRQHEAYKWGVNMSWTINAFHLGSQQAVAHFYDTEGVVGEMKMVLDTELTIDTPCRADVAYVDLTHEYRCALLNTTTTVSTTITATTSTSTTSTTTATTSTTSTSTTVTTSTVTTGYKWPPASDLQDGISTSMTVIQGSFTMEVPDATFFLDDTTAQDAVAAGVAIAIGVPPSYSTIMVKRLRRLATASRRLAGTVQIDWTVKIPSTADTAMMQAAVQRAMALTEMQLTLAISAQLQAVKGSSFDISVMSKTAPQVKEVAPEVSNPYAIPVVKVTKRSDARFTSGLGLATALSVCFVICRVFPAI